MFIIKSVCFLLLNFFLASCTVSDLQEQDVKTQTRGAIMFRANTHNFGNIEFGKQEKFSFRFRNVSGKDVEIKKVKTTCNCSNADWPKDVISRRGRGEISVIYTPDEPGEFYEYLYVYIKEYENPIQLTITGRVVPPEKGSENYIRYKREFGIDKENK